MAEHKEVGRARPLAPSLSCVLGDGFLTVAKLGPARAPAVPSRLPCGTQFSAQCTALLVTESGVVTTAFADLLIEVCSKTAAFSFVFLVVYNDIAWCVL